MKTILSILLMLFAISAWAAPVGEIAMLKGDASIVRGEQNIAAKVLLPIMAQDLIKTHKNSKLQLIFTDNTVITLGANTSFAIADYLYAEQNSRANFSVGSGTFKVITGRIGKLAPKSFLLKTQTSLIGIRGTIFAGDVGVTSADGSGDLLACLKGSISVQSLHAKSKVVIDDGKMIFVDDAGNLGAVKQIDAKVLPKFNNVQTQQSQDKPQAKVEDIDNKAINEDEEREQFDNLGQIHQYIADKKIVDYQGTLTGKSNAVIEDKYLHTNKMELDANIDANMDMSVDFGDNNPLKIKLSKQNINFTKVSKDGATVDPAAYNTIANTMDFNLESNMELQQRIDANKYTIDANSSKEVNGLEKNIKLTAKFSDSSAQAISGELSEHAKGRFGSYNKTIDRKIEAQFDVKQLTK